MILQGVLLSLFLSGASCMLDWPEPISDGDGDGDIDGDADTDGDGDIDADGDTDGDGDPGDNEVPELSSAPSIDGSLGDWDTRRFTSSATSAAHTEGSQSSPNTGDISVGFDFGWDSNFLYIAAEVTDDQSQSDSPNVWNDDSIEVYIDGDVDGDAGYDSNDHQYTATRDARFADRGSELEPSSRGIQLSVAEAGANWSLELAVPWSELGGSPSSGASLGLDLAYNDDDDGGEFDSHAVMWMRDSSGQLPVQDSTQFRRFTLQ